MLHALERHAPGGDVKDLVDELLGGGGKHGRIRCPKCAWQPKKSDRWFCSKCNRGVWNTFDTRGVCPVCKYEWKWTACLSCSQWSLHDDWYEKTPRQ